MSARILTPSEPTESPFEHPAFEALYVMALRDVADRRLAPVTRKAAARAVAFLLRERLVDERTVMDTLTAIHRSLDLAMVVRTLLVGLRDALGDHERMTWWTRQVVGRAYSERHVHSFVSAARILVGQRDFDGALPTSWQVSLIRASEDPRLRRRILLLASEYVHRFGSDTRWARVVRANFLAAARVDEADD